MLEDTLVPGSSPGYTEYGLVNPFQLGLQASRSQTQTAQAAAHYQDAHTLDRIVGTAKDILREVHFDKDLPAIEETLYHSFDDYKVLLTHAGIHLAEAARSFQDYGNGRNVNMAAADIRASSTTYSISSTNYALETAFAITTAKQLIQQSVFHHTISDLNQSISRHQYQRADELTQQSKAHQIHTGQYEMGVAQRTEQVGTYSLYTDALNLTVGLENFSDKAGTLEISAQESQIRFDEVYLSSEQYHQTARQYRVSGNTTDISGQTTTVSGNALNLSGSTVRIGGGVVIIGGAVPRATAPIERRPEALQAKTFQTIPDYATNSVVPSQSASGIQLGDTQVISPPQGTAGVHTMDNATRRPARDVTSYPYEPTVDESLKPPSL